ncbi:rCG25408, partial [Rattus norvegicus]
MSHCPDSPSNRITERN